MAALPSSPKNMTIKPSMAWLMVFLPALSYFVATRLQSAGFRWGRSSSLGDRVTSSLLLHSADTASSSACQSLADLFFLATATACSDLGIDTTTTTSSHQIQLQLPIPLHHGLNLLYQGRGMQHIVGSTWRHDEELGRGYLLVSQAHENGRVWRWEVGGGPIAIGRSLHLEASGCRSNQHLTCYPSNSNSDTAHTDTDSSSPIAAGSGGLAIDFHQGEGDSYMEGALIVAEWGEGRIIRMEESNGARTPLVVQVPDVCDGSNTTSTRRLHQPRSLLYTPYGDLLVADTAPDCQQAVIYRLSQAVHIEALESLAESRKAHAWTDTAAAHHHNNNDDADDGFGVVDILFQNGIQQIGGMAIDPSWLNMYVTVKNQQGQVLLLQVPIVVDDEDDDVQKAPTSSGRSGGHGGVMDDRAITVMDMTQALGISEPGPLVVSEKGHIFAAVPQGIAILSTNNNKSSNKAQILGVLSTPEPPTSLTLGGDKFLYAFSDDSMFRIRIREGPVSVPTNLVVGKKTKAA